MGIAVSAKDVVDQHIEPPMLAVMGLIRACTASSRR